MKYLTAAIYAFAAAVLLTVALPTHGSNLPPVDAVRLMTVEGEHACSAVVIAPNVALTAGHCLRPDDEMRVDGKLVTVVKFPAGKDIAVLRVPGLACPCVSFGVKPQKGDQIIAVGYPGDREGEREVSAVARVKDVTELNNVWPLPEPLPAKVGDDEYIFSDPVIRPGYSGGAAFSMQDGEWRVVGINAISIGQPGTCNFFGCAEWLYSGYVPVEQVKDLL